MQTLTVVIPAFNEEASLERYLPRVVEHCRRRHYQLIVVNDGSSDRTRGIIDQAALRGELRAIHHKMNRGYGAAIKSGIAGTSTDFLITIDADGQHELEDIDRLLQKAVDEDADMVVGSRRGQAAASVYRGVGRLAIRSFAKLLMLVPIHDLNSGMKLYRVDLARWYMPLCPDSMSYSDIIALTFLHRRHRVIEEPIRLNQRVDGTSSVSTATAFETVLDILHILMLFNPMRIFLPASAICILLGLAWGIPIILDKRGVSVGAMLAIMTGVIFFFLGLLAEQLSWIRRAPIEIQRTDDTLEGVRRR